jgi:hypothetical protein
VRGGDPTWDTLLEFRVRRLERSVGRITSGIVFAALLIGTMMGGRGRHLGR